MVALDGERRFSAVSIDPESRFARAMPDWSDLALSWHELQNLPGSCDQPWHIGKASTSSTTSPGRPALLARLPVMIILARGELETRAQQARNANGANL
jgi:hypothetical protein